MRPIPTSGTPGLPQDICDYLELITRKASPYDNVLEIPMKMQEGYFDSMDANALVGWIEDGFKENPPSQNAKRKLLFTGLDAAAIASEKEEFSPLIKLKIESTRKIYHELEEAAPTHHLILYKLYNEGTIIRAPGACFGIDIVLNPQNDELAPGFAEILDGLLITHEHGDHFDYQSKLHPELKKAGKPIILPEDDESVPFGGMLTEGKMGSLEWAAFRGGHVSMYFSSFFHLKVAHVGERVQDRGSGDGVNTNNTCMDTLSQDPSPQTPLPTKWKILHSGDNTRWIDFAKSDYAKDLDIFLLKPESLYIGREEHAGIQEAMDEMLREIHAKAIIPHHLLELGHGLGAYGHDMGFRLYQQVPEGVDVQMLQWGESIIMNNEE